MTVIIITIIDAALQLACRIHRGEKRRDIGDQKRCQGASGVDAATRVGAIIIDVVIRNGSNSVNAIIITTTITTIIPSTTDGRSGAGEELIQRRR